MKIYTMCFVGDFPPPPDGCLYKVTGGNILVFLIPL